MCARHALFSTHALWHIASKYTVSTVAQRSPGKLRKPGALAELRWVVASFLALDCAGRFGCDARGAECLQTSSDSVDPFTSHRHTAACSCEIPSTSVFPQCFAWREFSFPVAESQTGARAQGSSLCPLISLLGRLIAGILSILWYVCSAVSALFSLLGQTWFFFSCLINLRLEMFFVRTEVLFGDFCAFWFENTTICS